MEGESRIHRGVLQNSVLDHQAGATETLLTRLKYEFDEAGKVLTVSAQDLGSR
jgi:hypothetical protein